MARHNDAQGKGAPTLIHKIILGVFGALDIGAIIMLLTNDMTKIASRRGINIDGTIIGVVVAYLILLAIIHVLGIVRVASASDPENETKLRESKLTGLGEMILFTGLLAILVGILIVGPGVSTWLILFACGLIALGGLLVAIGLNRTVLKAALTAISVRRRNRRPAPKHSQQQQPQQQQPQRQRSPQQR